MEEMENVYGSYKPSDETVNIAIKWILKKIEANGYKIPTDFNRIGFGKDMRKYVEASNSIIRSGAVISTFPSFINAKKGGISLGAIFSKYGLSKYVTEFSIVLHKANITVRDGKGSGAVIVNGYDEINNKFIINNKARLYASSTSF